MRHLGPEGMTKRYDWLYGFRTPNDGRSVRPLGYGLLDLRSGSQPDNPSNLTRTWRNW